MRSGRRVALGVVLLVGIAVALLLNRAFRGRTLLGVLVLLPWAIPHVAASLVWRWIFNDQYGVLNWMLSSLGLSSFDGYSWFNNWLTVAVDIQREETQELYAKNDEGWGDNQAGNGGQISQEREREARDAGVKTIGELKAEHGEPEQEDEQSP
jgi:hypothetical protein